MSGLKGQRAIVTGTSRGIGRAIADQLGAEGAFVIGMARSLEPKDGDDGLDIPCDITDSAAVQEAVDRAFARAGVPDILVNNAGTFLLRPLAETTDNDFADQLAGNLTGPFYVLRAVLPRMVERGSGHVVTIGSVVDHRPYGGNAAYGSSKYGVRGLHEVTTEECRGTGVRTTLVSPGPTDTRAWDPMDPDGRADLMARADMLAPADVAAAVCYAVTQPARVAVEWIRIMPAA